METILAYTAYTIFLLIMKYKKNTHIRVYTHVYARIRVFGIFTVSSVSRQEMENQNGN